MVHKEITRPDGKQAHQVLERLDTAADNGIVWSASWVAVELDRFRRGRAIQETEHLGPVRCSGSLPLGSPECEVTRMKQIKIIIEKHSDGYVAYPVGIRGVVVGQGDSYEGALNDVKSAIKFHLETFGSESLDVDEPVLEAFVAEATV